MGISLTTKEEIDSLTDIYCALCSRNVGRDEWIFANTSLLPVPFICLDCAREIANMLEYYNDELEE